MSKLAEHDPEAFAVAAAEVARQRDTLEMIASENHCSAAVLEACGTALTDKYAEGYPRRRYYNGCEIADQAELLAIDRATRLFAGAEHVNVQPHSGTSANIAVYMAALKPGDRILGMDLAHGGHLSHGMSINYSGIYYDIVSYSLSRVNCRLDMDEVRKLALESRPRMIVAGASAYPRTIDFAAFAEIAREVGALLLCDIAHIAGLVAGGAHPSPLPMADFVTTTTHKTLRGPRGAMAFCKEAYARKLDSAVFPGLQGGPFMHTILAKAVAFGEALAPSFAAYAAQVVANAQALAEVLLEKGWTLITGGTDNHMILVDLRGRDENMTGNDAANWLAAAGIICNKNMIPFDPRPPAQASGLRFGTPALTTRGLKQPQIRQVGLWIDQVLGSRGDAAVTQKVAAAVGEMTRQFPVPNQIP